MPSRLPTDDALSKSLAPLARLLLPFLVAELAKHQEEEPSGYSSVALPPNVTRRAFREFCKSGRVHGAELDGRVWRCSRAAWSDARRSKPRAPALRVVASNDEQLAELALDGARLRSTTRRSA